MPRMSSRTRSGERLVASALPLPPPADVPGLKLKTKYPYYTVTQLILKANESGDGEEARRVYKAFEDKRLFWKKTLRFHEDSRPAYEGTWTKPSITVGPRTPFALDNAIDYSVDEGLEWEAEDPAEVDIASVLDEDEDMDDGDESDEMDDWMVGDDEIEFEEGAEGWAEAQEFKKGEQKPVVEDCYTEVGRAGAATKSQRFTRLVPFQKGPCMETRLGDVDPFMLKYRICLLNGTLSMQNEGRQFLTNL
jgi:chromatin assembly factor 1 subunit A